MTALLTSREVAQLLHLSTRTLERLRCSGRGPKFIRIGKSIRYEYGALTSYCAARVVANTSQQVEETRQ
jgi:predicted DNA-binding transcriptional regulator AlpA